MLYKPNIGISKLAFNNKNQLKEKKWNTEN